MVRSSVLATFLKKHGCQVEFLTRKEALVENVKESLKEFDLVPVPAGVEKFKWVTKYLKKDPPSILSVDSYDVASVHLKVLKKFAGVQVVIDDLAKIRFPSDIIVNGNIYAPAMKYKTFGKSLLLLGTRYTLLRPVFREVRKKPIRKHVRNVLIVMGGADLGGMTLPVLRVVSRMTDVETINVVFGPYVKAARGAGGIAPGKSLNFYRSPNAQKLKALMEVADLAISAGGQTLYELASCGTPTIGICIGKDQERNLQCLNKTGCCVSLGWAKSRKWTKRLKSTLEMLCDDTTRRRKMSVEGRKLVDGLGGDRVARIVVSLAGDKSVQKRTAHIFRLYDRILLKGSSNAQDSCGR